MGANSKVASVAHCCCSDERSTAVVLSLRARPEGNGDVCRSGGPVVLVYQTVEALSAHGRSRATVGCRLTLANIEREMGPLTVVVIEVSLKNEVTLDRECSGARLRSGARVILTPLTIAA